MTWTKLGEDFHDRPEIYRVSRSARLLHIEAMVWCNKRGTDGLIEAGAVARICDDSSWRELVSELEGSGAWQPITEATWRLDWSEQEDAVDVKARRDARAEVQKRYRKRVAAHARGDHSMCDPRHCPALVSGHETSNGTGHETTPRPVPSLPVPKGQGQGQGAGPDAAGASPASPPGSRRRLPPPHEFDAGECCELLPEHPVHDVERTA